MRDAHLIKYPTVYYCTCQFNKEAFANKRMNTLNLYCEELKYFYFLLLLIKAWMPTAFLNKKFQCKYKSDPFSI